MSASPECYHDPEGDAALIACLKAEVAELRAARAVPVRLIALAGTASTLYALDAEGRPWESISTHGGRAWRPLPSPVLDSPRP